MNKWRTILLTALLAAMLLAPSASTVASPNPDAANALAAVTSTLNFQGRLTATDGTPVADGAHVVTFRLYTASSGGSALATSTQTVQTERGVFSTFLDFGAALAQFNGQALYVGVQPEGAPAELTPRIVVRPVPYALSLRTGARIEGTATGHDLGGAVFNVSNSSTSAGHAAILGISGDVATVYPSLVAGVIGESAHGQGVSGISTDGTGTYGYSNSGYGIFGASVSGTGVRAVSSSGADIVAAGTGIIQSVATSQIWISGNSLVKNVSTDTTRWDMQINGAARIYNGAATSDIKAIYYPIILPSVLYGQPVTLSRLTIYYVCHDGTKGYITGTYLSKQSDADSALSILSDGTDHTSSTATSYALGLSVNNSLTADQGSLGLYINLHFDDDTNWVQIGGVRLELEHAP